MLALAWGALSVLAAPSSAQTPAAALAERYSPVIALHAQTRPCGPGEAYRPTVVDILLDNREVALRNAAGRIVKRGPTAKDLHEAPAGDYIDLPGKPLRPGCGYEKQFKAWFGDRRPTVYAHVAGDTQRPGKLAVQYWLFYTFNDFSNKHEGDWEMVQLDFNAATPEAALGGEPYEIDLAQHGGGERGSWKGDPKLVKDGTHPVLYVGAVRRDGVACHVLPEQPLPGQERQRRLWL